MKGIWHFLALATTILALQIPAVASAQQSLRAAAIVNDEVISLLDLEMRIGGHQVTTGGRVVHGTRLDPQPGVESASRLGIEFVDMDEEAEQAIRNLIRHAIR